jgi:hypothetical protein
MRGNAAKLLIAGAAFASVLFGRKFYDDDPLLREPAPVPVQSATSRSISDIYDFLWHTFATPGDRVTPLRAVPAQDVNTLGEVLEGAWYEKRHAARRLSTADLKAGVRQSGGPADGPWTVVSAKSEGVTPGFVIEDERKRRYFLKFDPVQNPEIATAADVIGARFFHALGYHTPENHIVRFTSKRLRVRPGATFRDRHGRLRELGAKDIDEILQKAPRIATGELRACASLMVPGKPVGPFRYFGTRTDDPNDTVPHEHRRSLRGLHVFGAWLGHDDSRAINTLDTLVAGDGPPHLRHYLIDFGSLFGSASNGPTSARSGFEPLFSWKNAALEFLTLGMHVPTWARIRYPDLPSVGRFGTEHFDPVSWTPEYPNPAFANRLPEDNFWAAEQVMSFTNDDIQALVESGQYTDRAAEDYMVKTLAGRRDAIGRAYLSGPLAISRFRIESGSVRFDDLALLHGYRSEPEAYTYAWSDFDNETGHHIRIPGAGTPAIPQREAMWLSLHITPGNENRRVTVYLKRTSTVYRIVGIERVFQK